MANKRIDEFPELLELDDNDLVLVFSGSQTFAVKVATLKEVFDGGGGGGGGAVTSVNGKTGVVVLNASDVGAGTYTKPSGGIPKSDLASAVRTSLGKADTALQTAPVTSVNGKTGAITLSPSDIDAKAIQAEISSPSTAGTAIAFINNITQDKQGVITATKKRVQTATTEQDGLMSSEDKQLLEHTYEMTIAAYPAIERSGESVTINDTVAAPLRGLTIYGKSVQSSTPTPSAPVTIATAGSSGTQIIVDIDIRASHAYARDIPTPNSLLGIKVSSGGNHTDANNQQWLCDTIDKTTAKYTQRVGVFTLDGEYTPTTIETVGSYTRFWYQVSGTSMTPSTGTLCSHLPYDPSGYAQERAGFGIDSNYPRNIWAKLPTSLVGSTAASIKTWMQSNPMTLVAALATPAETDLTDSQVIALNLPNSYDGGTTVRSGGDVTPDITVTAAVTVEAYVDYRLANATN